MKRLLYIFLIAVFFVSCKNVSEESPQKDTKYGGTLKINETEFIRTIYPPGVEDNVSLHVIFQVYEGLVKYDTKDISNILPAIAHKWDIDSTNTVYTFYLNDSIYFHDDECFDGGKGRKVTAEDFKYTFELLCANTKDNKNFLGTLDKVVGAREYYEAGITGKPDFDIEGIKVIDEKTLQITIDSPNPLFIYFMANPAASLMAHEAVEKYGIRNTVGTGPFKIKELPQENDPLYLVRNDKYYKKDKNKDQLPFLDTIVITFISSTQKELNMFVDGDLDIVFGLPGDYIPKFLDDHIEEFESNPPKYILHPEEKTTDVYSLLKSQVNGFYTNSQSYIDMSIIYFEEPKPYVEKKDK